MSFLVCYLCVLLSSLLTHMVSGSYFFHSELNIWIHAKSNTMSSYIGLQSFNFTALTTSRAFDNICLTLPKTEINGRVVLYIGDFRGCSYEDMARNVQMAGGRCLIYIQQSFLWPSKFSEAVEVTGSGEFALDNSDKSNIHIPYIMITEKYMKPIFAMLDSGKYQEGVLFHVNPDPNPHIHPIDTFLVCRICSWVLLVPWSLINTIYAADTARWFYKQEIGFSFQSLPQIACTVEVLSNLLRLVFVSLGPFLSWHIWTLPIFHILFTITMPLAFLSSLLIALYWKMVCDRIETLSKTILNIRPYRYILATVFFAEAFISYIAMYYRATYQPLGIWLLAQVAIEFVSSGGIIVYFIMQGRRLVNILKIHTKSMNLDINTEDSYLKYAIAKMSKWIIVSACFTFIFLLATFAISTPLFYTPAGFVGLMFLSFIGILGTSSTQVIAFRANLSSDTFNKKKEKDNLIIREKNINVTEFFYPQQHTNNMISMSDTVSDEIRAYLEEVTQRVVSLPSSDIIPAIRGNLKEMIIEKSIPPVIILDILKTSILNKFTVKSEKSYILECAQKCEQQVKIGKTPLSALEVFISRVINIHEIH